MIRNKGVDIIIPVYNALEDLQICLESIKKHTNLALDRVVMIDDCSPDPNVFPYMQSMAGEGIVVLQNQQNQGFSGTINRGLAYSDRYVILLNSDTVVTEGWVDKLVACADSDPSIGTVTPFSNNATLCSIPDFCQENTVPYGLSIDEYARIIERCSMKVYPRITVAVGFCMLIKREVVEAVGLFDQETFQRGYGEENDFCWRAEQLGYHHVLCDDTYIYHSGSASFVSKEKQKLMEDHERILQEWYPRQIQKNAEYVRDNPHQYLRTNVELYAQLKNGKKNLLYVLHADFRQDAENHIGGTQFHVKDLVRHLRRDYNLFVMARDGRMLRLTLYLEEKQVSFKFPIGQRPDFQCFRSARIGEILRQVLTAFEIDLVHVHHVQGLSFDVFHIAHEMGIPLTATLHDYFYICPTVVLLEDGSYCAGRGKDCGKCLKNQLGCAQQTRYLDHWRKVCGEALSLCDVLVTPSEAAKSVYADIYPELATRVRVVPHGLDPFEEKECAFGKETQGFRFNVEYAFKDGCTISGWALMDQVESRNCAFSMVLEDKEGTMGRYSGVLSNRPDVAETRGALYMNSGFQVAVPDCWFATGPLKMQLILHSGEQEFYSAVTTVNGYKKQEKRKKRIAFLGGISEAKGSRLAYEMIKQSGNRYEWYILGGVGDPNLITLTAPNVRKTGWYQRQDVAGILHQNQIDLVCILSIVAETFCYTVSEAELSGVPIVATDIGALGERLSRDGTGWLLPADSTPKEALEKIGEIFAREEEFAQVKARTEQFSHISAAQMCEHYRELYDRFPAPRKNGGTFDPRAILDAHTLGQGTGHGDATDTDLIRQINQLEATLQTIHQSLEYRMVKFFNREKIPFKGAIKWMIGFAYRVYVKLKKRR